MTEDDSNTRSKTPMAVFSSALNDATAALSEALSARANAVEYPDVDLTGEPEEIKAKAEEAEKRYRALVEDAAALTPYERRALDLVVWLAAIFADGRELQPFEQEILARIDGAMAHPADKDRKIALADTIVKDHAERYQLAATAGPDYKGNTPAEIVHNLGVELWSAVNKGFGVLDEMGPAVAELLGEYKADSGRRTKDGKGSGRLSSAGILAELNAYAGNPLALIPKERDGMAHAIANAVGRAKSKHIPNLGT